ncbi:MAG TPA: hypothetical protein VKQ52_15465 [Puia sp.]|nr:hypothetical protein [Puia sp.]
MSRHQDNKKNERNPARDKTGRDPHPQPRAVNPFEKKKETPPEKAAEKEQADLEQQHKEADTERD